MYPLRLLQLIEIGVAVANVKHITNVTGDLHNVSILF